MGEVSQAEIFFGLFQKKNHLTNFYYLENLNIYSKKYLYIYTLEN